MVYLLPTSLQRYLSCSWVRLCRQMDKGMGLWGPQHDGAGAGQLGVFGEEMGAGGEEGLEKLRRGAGLSV